jgi:hypothetical protein
MALLKLETGDGFVVRDFSDGPSVGVVRRAKKILQSSAADLARSATYTFAAFEYPVSGASAGLNLAGDPTDEAVAAALESSVAELAQLGQEHQISLQAGKGMTAELVRSLHPTLPVDAELATTAGVLAAASWAVDGRLDGSRVALEQTKASPAPASLVAALGEAGAQIVDVDGADTQPWKIWAADVDIILAGSKPGVLNHQGAELLTAAAVVPWGPIPYTTRALATATRLGRTRILPDFVTAAGALLVDRLADGLNGGSAGGSAGGSLDQLADRVQSLLSETADHDDGPVLGACHRAESFLTTWRPAVPFGRPMAA